ncbi:MAG: hypothetical protein P9L92_13565 [Candidatus Electryonea clarkiae]|nr:hypothetical protein [Candidatus Electryonea clarkiae]MDP8285654.1 hypothetical protein [Candidatus Electryonea clarkiae]
MIETIIDGNQAVNDFSDISTIAEAVRKIAKTLSEDRSVIKVYLDGQDVTGQFEVQEDELSNHNRLEVTTGRMDMVALEALESLTDFHAALLKELNQVSEEYRVGDEEKAHQIFAKCLDGLQILMKTTITAANLLRMKATDIVSGENNLEKTTLDINSLLDEMIEAQTQRDVILLADLVEYELIPSMEDWGGYMKCLQDVGSVV